VALLDPTQELVGVGGALGRSDAAIIEAELGGDELQVGLGDGGIDGGSKSQRALSME